MSRPDGDAFEVADAVPVHVGTDPFAAAAVAARLDAAGVPVRTADPSFGGGLGGGGPRPTIVVAVPADRADEARRVLDATDDGGDGDPEFDAADSDAPADDEIAAFTGRPLRSPGFAGLPWPARIGFVIAVGLLLATVALGLAGLIFGP